MRAARGRNPQAAHMVRIFSNLNYPQLCTHSSAIANEHERLSGIADTQGKPACVWTALWATCSAAVMRISVVINAGLMVSSDPKARDAISAAV